MTDKTVERIYGATNRCKLFVSPTKVSIRYKEGLKDDDLMRIESFMLKAASLVVCDRTVRGHLGLHRESDTYYIVLQDVGKTYSMRVAETQV